MKALKIMSILPIVFMTIGIAQAKGDIFYNVPFHNVEIKAASKIYAEYNFNSHDQTLVCKQDPSSSAITSIEWVYKDVTRKIGLPVKLKDDSKIKDGYFADPDGKLVITNEFGSETGSIFVSCDIINI